MPKLCQKCHKNPAVVHFRAYGQDGRHSTVSYCLPCAIKMASDEETPSEMRQMLQGMMKDLREDFPSELAEMQERGEFSAEDLMVNDGEEKKIPLRRRRKFSDSKAKEPSKSTCPFCHRDIAASLHSDGTSKKCGHCLTAVRDVIREHFVLDIHNGHSNSAEAVGLPIFCKKRVARESEGKPSATSDCQRLTSMLGRYHVALAARKWDGAELLKEELNCLRRNLTEEMRRYAASHASKDDVADFLALPQLTTCELRDEFWRYGWLPMTGGGTTNHQIRLASSIFFYRTIVDWPMPKEASADDYHKRLAEFLWQDPIFEGGKWIPDDKSLCTENHRLVIDCGSGAYCQSRSFSFEGQIFGKPGENVGMMNHLRAFLRRLECRCTFFTDPELGFYSPRREALGSCIYPMEYLHLPALCMTEGLQNIQRVIQSMDKSGCSDNMPTILLTTPEGIPECGDANHGNPIGLLSIVDTRACGTPLRERVMNLNRVAKFLEKEEMQARRRLKANILRHREIEDMVARSLSVLRNARLISQSEAVLAVSRLWLGIELGCISSIPKAVLFQAMRTALMQDSDFSNSLFMRRYKREDVSVAKDMDYSKPMLDDLDQLGEVLWEDQNPDIALPVAAEKKASSHDDPLGLGDLFGDILGDPMQMLEKIRDVFDRHQPPRESLEDAATHSRFNDSRAFLLRDLLAKRTDDDLFWGIR